MIISYDFEFLENGRTIKPISVGMVAEDGREYYAVNYDAPWGKIRWHNWLMRNVVPELPVTGRDVLERFCASTYNVSALHIGISASVSSSWPARLREVGPDTGDVAVRPGWVIANEVQEFITSTPGPELWADHAAYDHVALCQLWGKMIDLPPGVPMWTADLRQEVTKQDVEVPAMPGSREHHALWDAREVMFRLGWLGEASGNRWADEGRRVRASATDHEWRAAVTAEKAARAARMAGVPATAEEEGELWTSARCPDGCPGRSRSRSGRWTGGACIT